MQKKLIKLKKQTPAGADLSEALPVSQTVPVGANFHKSGDNLTPAFNIKTYMRLKWLYLHAYNTGAL